ncbi:MAG: Peptidyl-prolyl cis-trans isomerase [Candidatus Magasanikbacteria bacterium GW2011_GWA2_46_17]|uniref:Peptidyl-prolyl cis-trans isomerase n=1 Tax=Candidatus Magasanikbacteria bacterium GW2011_GWA2_46_17 TaxID=1619042 RepID=A0A0G1P106_9BACT|nr:MAG: Peptidyl-prolyl cis-trans isomerase [Candidatus Magasanikbacteria bacterium GW2011_GWA2_46_17]
MQNHETVEEKIESQMVESSTFGVCVSAFQKLKETNARLFLYGIVGVLALSLVGMAAAGVYRAYAMGATDAFTVNVAQVIRLPVLKVDGVPIMYADYAEDIKAIKQMRDYDKKNGGPGADLTEEQMSDQVLWRLANTILVDRAAAKYNIRISDQDVENLKATVLQQYKDTATVEKELAERYGWTLADYEEKVMRPFVLQNSLKQAVEADPSLKANSFNKALDVLNQIKGGADFTAMARKHGQDGTAAEGGDLGWFARGEMVPQFEAAVFAMRKGEISQTPVESPFGFHLIKLEDTKKENKKENGKQVMVEKVLARHILFRAPDIEQYLDTMARQADIHLYSRIHNPFEEMRRS